VCLFRSFVGAFLCRNPAQVAFARSGEQRLLLAVLSLDLLVEVFLDAVEGILLRVDFLLHLNFIFQ